MSEADKIIESLKNSGKKVEEFYMSNKTSDKNVANIEDDVKFVRECSKLIELFIIRITTSDSTFEEFRRDNGIEKEKDYNDYDDVGYSRALERVLAEREQDKKRIKELEADLYSANEIISDLIDSIPKQVVIELIENETIDISGFECIAVEDLKKLLEDK